MKNNKCPFQIIYHTLPYLINIWATAIISLDLFSNTLNSFLDTYKSCIVEYCAEDILDEIFVKKTSLIYQTLRSL